MLGLKSPAYPLPVSTTRAENQAPRVA